MRRKLAKEALYRPGQPSSSAEIDEGFNRASEAFQRKQAELRRLNPHLDTSTERKQNIRNHYALRGLLYTEDMPIRLDESILAKDDLEALKIARRKAREYRDFEDYAVQLFLYNNSNKQIKSIYMPKRGD